MKLRCGILLNVCLELVFSLVAITTLVAGVGVVAFAYIFKKDFEDIERKTKEIISDIESKNN